MGTPLLTQRHKKGRLGVEAKSFWENVQWTDQTKIDIFRKAHHCSVYRKQYEAFNENKMVEAHRYSGVAFQLLAPDAFTVYMASLNLKSTK